jgi:hypothetical protein
MEKNRWIIIYIIGAMVVVRAINYLMVLVPWLRNGFCNIITRWDDGNYVTDEQTDTGKFRFLDPILAV